MRAESTPTKYAIFGDVHGNLEALDAVLESMEKEGVTHCACVGDIVGYGANPVECLEKIRGLGCKAVLGNHDAGVIGKTDIKFFNSAARAAVEWSREVVDGTASTYLSALPHVDRTEAFTIVHATLGNPEQWTYIFGPFEAENYFRYQKDPVCFVGHTHVPCCFSTDPTGNYSRPMRVRLKAGVKYIINVGSVGQPRDGNPMASYVIYDLVDDVIKFVRVPYDVTTAQKKIINAGLPHVLAIRLEWGK